MVQTDMHSAMKFAKKRTLNIPKKKNGMGQGVCRSGKRPKKEQKHEKNAGKRRVSRFQRACVAILVRPAA